MSHRRYDGLLCVLTAPSAVWANQRSLRVYHSEAGCAKLWRCAGAGGTSDVSA